MAVLSSPKKKFALLILADRRVNIHTRCPLPKVSRRSTGKYPAQVLAIRRTSLSKRGFSWRASLFRSLVYVQKKTKATAQAECFERLHRGRDSVVEA